MVDYLLTIMHALYFSEIPKFITRIPPLFLHVAIRAPVSYQYIYENKSGNDPQRPQIWRDQF